MSLTPFLNADPAVQIHAFTALAMLPLTAVLFSMRKGNPLHRVMGWTWVIMMAVVALSSFAIQELRLIGPFSPIHLLSLLALTGLVQAVRAARRHVTASHRRHMLSLTLGALVAAGVFALLPGRIMFAVAAGG